MEDVIITEEANNTIALNRKSQGTRLKSVKGVEIAEIKNDHLRLFCSKHGISGTRKKAKVEVCQCIVKAKLTGEWKGIEKAKDKPVDDKSNKPAGRGVTINRRRHMNVIFSDLVRPHLSSLGESIERPELDRDIKTDQQFHELVAGEYNKGDVDEYNQNAFPYLVKGRSLPPSHFQPIDWSKSKQSFKDICREYETCFKK